MVRLFLICGAAKAPCATPFLGGWGLHRYDKSMSNDKFSVEESAALLHAIFPNYPDILRDEARAGGWSVLVDLASRRAVANWRRTH
jgi:hypothetical protein